MIKAEIEDPWLWIASAVSEGAKSMWEAYYSLDFHELAQAYAMKVYHNSFKPDTKNK